MEVDEDMILHQPWLSIAIGDAISFLDFHERMERRHGRRTPIEMMIDKACGLG